MKGFEAGKNFFCAAFTGTQVTIKKPKKYIEPILTPITTHEILDNSLQIMTSNLHSSRNEHFQI